uniref:hypothetical protein n=1 Tax=Rheinheimera sp. TaxID=1869214 RepID=UPI004047AAAE
MRLQLPGVQACADLNRNLRCDDDEPEATTTADGSYQLSWTSPTLNPDYYLLAYWPKPNGLVSLTSISQNPDHIVIGARKEQQGAINPLTTLELEALRLALLQGFTSAQQQQLLDDLRAIYADIYQLPAAEVFQKIYQADDYLPLMQLHTRLIVDTMIVAGAMYPKAPAQVTQQLHAELLARMQSENLSVLELFGTHGEEIAQRIEQVLFELGYGDGGGNGDGGDTSPPFNPTVLNDTDWQAVKTALFQEDGREYSLALGASRKTTAQLLYGDTGLVVDTVLGQVFLDVDSELAQCWNESLSVWVNEDDVELVLSNQTDNSIDADFAGSGKAIRYQFSKIDSSSEVWQTLTEDSYAHFELASIAWPDVVYRYQMQLTEPVLCRELDYNTQPVASLLSETVQQLTTAEVAEMFFPQEFAEGKVTIDDEADNRFMVNVGNNYQWELVTAPDNSILIKLASYGTVYPNDFTEYYVVEDQQVFEVQLLTPEWVEQTNSHFIRVTLPQALATNLAEHFQSLVN